MLGQETPQERLDWVMQTLQGDRRARVRTKITAALEAEHPLKSLIPTTTIAFAAPNDILPTFDDPPLSEKGGASDANPPVATETHTSGLFDHHPFLDEFVNLFSLDLTPENIQKMARQKRQQALMRGYTYNAFERQELRIITGTEDALQKERFCVIMGHFGTVSTGPMTYVDIDSDKERLLDVPIEDVINMDEYAVAFFAGLCIKRNFKTTILIKDVDLASRVAQRVNNFYGSRMLRLINSGRTLKIADVRQIKPSLLEEFRDLYGSSSD